VEDYMIQIQRNPNQNPLNSLDVNADGGVSAIDVLYVVNFINENGPATRLPINAATPPYYDVNGNGIVEPLDILALVNYINDNRFLGGNSEGEGEASDMWHAAPPASRNQVDTASTQSPASESDEYEYSSYFDEIDSAIAPYVPEDLVDWSIVGPIVSSESDSSEEDDYVGAALDELLSET
jgi:hypothetical protein